MISLPFSEFITCHSLYSEAWHWDSRGYNLRASISSRIVAIQLLSLTWLFVTSWIAALSLLKLMYVSSESVMPSNHLILCRPLLLLPSVFPSIRVFSNELTLPIRWPKHWNFHFSPSHVYSGLIFFRIDWFDLLAVQGTLKSLLQHQKSKASVLWHSAFFIVQLSHPLDHKLGPSSFHPPRVSSDDSVNSVLSPLLKRILYDTNMHSLWEQYYPQGSKNWFIVGGG